MPPWKNLTMPGHTFLAKEASEAFLPPAFAAQPSPGWKGVPGVPTPPGAPVKGDFLKGVLW
eukprot:1747642-Alexandrium_andersonii.AAC.1